MSAELHVHSELPPISWQKFKQTHPAGSIALDGYVGHGPEFDSVGPYYNANHHEGVKRLETLSTAQQILMNLRMGLVDAFSENGVFKPGVYVNDCDQDVCLAWYLLKRPNEARIASPVLAELVKVAGVLDCTAGAYPYNADLQIMQQQAWVFEPYTQFRAAGGLYGKNNADYQDVIESVGGRIDRHILGSGEQLELDTKYELLGGGEGWSMIREIGEHGRVGAFNDGINAYVSAREIGEDRWCYSIGRRSEFYDFDLQSLIDHFNKLEDCQDEDCWGTSSTVGGSPRVAGSGLSPEQLETVINKQLQLAKSVC